MARIHAVAAAALALTLLAACGDDDDAAEAVAPATSTTADGPSATLGQGKVWTYVVSEAGKPVEVGVRLDGAALTGLPEHPGGEHGHPLPVVLAFPGGAATGVLDHVEFYWNPQGHEPPGVWDKPHFDYHFFMTDAASAAAIVPTAEGFATKGSKLPDAKYVPADFVAPPGKTIDNVIPGMGLHWLDSTEPPVPGKYQFTETMIHGSYDGAMTFLEPMITREWLLTKTPLTEQLKLPKAFAESGLWPTTYTVRYDAAKDEYSVALGGFVDRQAS